jgi:hypothetical protein
MVGETPERKSLKLTFSHYYGGRDRLQKFRRKAGDKVDHVSVARRSEVLAAFHRFAVPVLDVGSVPADPPLADVMLAG